MALSGGASALGLGDLRGQPVLGERLRVEIDLLGEGRSAPDAACFRLVRPASGDDLPWLKSGSFVVRRSVPAVLELRTEMPVREPVLQLAILAGCGHEVVREYLLLASPANQGAVLPMQKPEIRSAVVTGGGENAEVSGRRERARHAAAIALPERVVPRRSERRSSAPALNDRLMLSAGGGDIAEPSLRLATELGGAGTREAGEAQRDILRLEFRMLLAMHEQATSQLETAEKLRNMEATLAELQTRAAEFGQRAEQQASEGPMAASSVAASASPPPVSEVKTPTAAAPGGGGEWHLYALLVGAVLGLAGWFGWRAYQARQARQEEELILLVEPDVDPQRDSEHVELGGVDLSVEPAAMGMPMQVDIDLIAQDEPVEPMVAAAVVAPVPHDSVLSVAATTVDEHFEANPVMELADIMLSFGRVKGAAQALQEYIDNNPQEALQPWIRLMDVYRMAGMRDEFEAVSRNLNQNFNVEVQQWEASSGRGTTPTLDLVLDETVPLISAIEPSKPESLEDMPRLMNAVCEIWQGGDAVGYLHQLLRDNRGGQRTGFALAVVEEILFLIELKETVNRLEKESAAS